ncbi:MAG: three-Cys-motif partner protein TcmP [Phycisphaera sp.]|nr:MAG: three-Cys-motif partner protein TcmP [Phycisphaera sp.]
MTHQADEQFFVAKRSWSKQKDRILEGYLSNYLPKVSQAIGRPILVVDGFVGPGKFSDNSDGSPLLIARCIARSRFSAKLIAIEANASLHKQLCDTLGPFSFATAKHGSFEEHLGDILQASKTHSVFLFLDPFALKGLDLASLDHVFRLLEAGSSIELLLNFNAFAFCRCARASLKAPLEIDEEAAPVPTLSPAVLNTIAGGDWWQEFVAPDVSFVDQVDNTILGFRKTLETRFKHVQFYKVFASDSHRIPKYFLVFASRSDTALSLMNDEAVNARREFLANEYPRDSGLFDIVQLEKTRHGADIDATILAGAREWTERGTLIQHVIECWFGYLLRKEIRSRIQELLRTGHLASKDGRTTLNDNALIRQCEPPPLLFDS